MQRCFPNTKSSNMAAVPETSRQHRQNFPEIPKLTSQSSIRAFSASDMKQRKSSATATGIAQVSVAQSKMKPNEPSLKSIYTVDARMKISQQKPYCSSKRVSTRSSQKKRMSEAKSAKQLRTLNHIFRKRQ